METAEYGVKQYFTRVKRYLTDIFYFMGHKVEKTESRPKIVAKSQQSLFNKSNRIEICSQ